MKLVTYIKAAAVSLALSFGAAHAGLVGDSVGIEFKGSGGGSSGLQTSIVGPGEEGAFLGALFYDFTDTGFSARTTGQYVGLFSDLSSSSVTLTLSDLDFGADILQGVNFTSVFNNVALQWDEHSISFTWAEQTVPIGNLFTVSFITAQVSTVPEPSSLALLGLGLAGLAVMRKRKKA